MKTTRITVHALKLHATLLGHNLMPNVRRGGRLLLLLGFCLAGTALAEPDPRHDGLSVSREDLTGWQELYWSWAFGGVTVPTDQNGNAAVGNVVLMPVPITPGDGTPGHLDVTLEAGQSWVMPLWTLLGTSYTDGTPDDPFVGIGIFRTLDISFKIDGRTIVDEDNVLDFFAKSTYHPPIPLPADYAPMKAIIWVEDIGVVAHPLSVGVHTLKLDVKNTEALPPNFGGGFSEFHNTWTVTVQPRAH
jgi:hypothetical protein